jgi:hypothetical protein
MANTPIDNVGDTTQTTGTSDFVVDGVALLSTNSFASRLTNGVTYGYHCETSDKLTWETGTGAWTAASSTIARTTQSASSAGGAKVSFPSGSKSIGIVIQAADFVADVASATHAATGKATPVDADELPLVDSAASNVLKKLTWANLKATLKTYTDTLYALTGLATGSGLTMTTGKLIGRGTAGTGALEEITLGTGLSMSGTTLNGSSSGATLGANTFTDKQTITQGTANTGVLASTGYSLTGSNATNMIDLAGTVNTSGNPVMMKIALTNTASGSTTKFASFLAGASGTTEVFAVDKAGTVVLAAGSSSSAVLKYSGDSRGWYFGNGAIGGINSSGVVFVAPNSSGVGWQIQPTGVFGWSSTAGADNAADAGFGRAATKVPEVNDGTKGSYVGTALVLGPQTVAQLPAAATALKGARATVTDANATTFLSVVAGSGANIVPVFCNGTNWLIG